jgi:hypothetical protein
MIESKKNLVTHKTFVSKRKRRKPVTLNFFDDVITKNFPSLVKDRNLGIQETQ